MRLQLASTIQIKTKIKNNEVLAYGHNEDNHLIKVYFNKKMLNKIVYLKNGIILCTFASDFFDLRYFNFIITELHEKIQEYVKSPQTNS